MEITYTSCAICTSYFPTVRKNYQQEVRADGQKYADRTCGRDHVMESSLNLTMRHWKSMDDLRYCVSAKKTYRLSDIRGSRTKEESYKVYSGDGIPASGWDVVTTFYDASGKKVFRFGLAYNNVERLKKDIENIQKSIARKRKSRKGC